MSSVFAPEMCGEGRTRYFFGYNVRFSLLPVDQQRDMAQQQQQEFDDRDAIVAVGRSCPVGSGVEGHQAMPQQAPAGPTPDSGTAGSGLLRERDSGSALARSSGDGGGSGGGGNGGGSSGSGVLHGGANGPPGFAPVRRVQLESRAWRILSAAGEVLNEVVGEGVIGEYPRLEAGDSEFVYQSCTHQAERLGFMEGSFKFVEGLLEQPQGSIIHAVCPRFELRVPDFLY